MAGQAQPDSKEILNFKSRAKSRTGWTLFSFTDALIAGQSAGHADR
jgi:hypothetical protein